MHAELATGWKGGGPGKHKDSHNVTPNADLGYEVKCKDVVKYGASGTGGRICLRQCVHRRTEPSSSGHASNMSVLRIGAWNNNNGMPDKVTWFEYTTLTIFLLGYFHCDGKR